jgi:hypothetical protein
MPKVIEAVKKESLFSAYIFRLAFSTLRITEKMGNVFRTHAKINEATYPSVYVKSNVTGR